MNNLNYTDFHDVDEDITSISVCDGGWHDGENAGIAYRHLGDAHSFVFDHVASMKK